MNSDDILGYAVVIALIIIPALAFTARFALKPIVESVLRLRDALDTERRAVEDPRVPMLQQEISDLRDSVDRLTAAVDFDTQLRASGAAAAPRLPGPEA